jgi:uncharacterized protein (DUF1810 family)
MYDLSRFRTAQDADDAGFEQALREIRSGRKRGHWIWYVFPQIAGLGFSSMSQTYAISDSSEAADYLRDPVLGQRLLMITQAVLDRMAGPTRSDLTALMSSAIDAQKLVSSLTLFGSVARQIGALDGGQKFIAFADIADQVLAVAEAQGYPRCRFTLDRLG